MSVLGLHGSLAELEQLHVESNIERSRHLCIQHFRIHTSEHMVRPVCMHDADICIPIYRAIACSTQIGNLQHSFGVPNML